MIKVIDKLLEPGEYYDDIYLKDTFWVHHSAGGHRPDYGIAAWEHDVNKSGGQLKVACPYFIGGISITDGNADWDGVICRAHDERKWAYHLGIKAPNNDLIHKHAISVELCNYGPLIKTKDGIYLNYVNKPVPPEMVISLPVPFRGFTHWHKYTDKQIESLKWLILDVAKRNPSINIKAGLPALLHQIGDGAYNINSMALDGKPGIWTHTNVRSDKTDLYPYSKMTEMLKSLMNENV